MNPVLLNVYEAGDKIGGIAAYALTIIGALIFIWVMFKYLDTSELNG